MNKNRVGLLLVIVALGALTFWLLWSPPKPGKAVSLLPSDPVSAPHIETAPSGKLNITRRTELSAEDMADFTNRFNQRFKPEIARWCKIYAGRLPFGPDDVTPDKFHSKVGGFLYTFMIGSTTFTVYDGPTGTHVFYLMTKQASQALNSLPSGAEQHDISVSASRSDIVGLLKADSGIDYPSDQISIHPTGQFSSMPGGVMVEAGGITGNNTFRVMSPTNLDFVLDGNGTLVSYQH